MACGCNNTLNKTLNQIDNINTLPVQTLQVKSIDEVIDLFRQGYRLDTNSIKYTNGNTIVSMAGATDTVSVIGSGLIISIAVFMIMSLLYYKIGKWEAKALGMD